MISKNGSRHCELIRPLTKPIFMQVIKIDHVNIRTTQLDVMVNWYTETLGLNAGKRPNSRSVGAWMYAGDTPLVHLVEIADSAAIGSESSLKLEHFSLKATGAASFESQLNATGEKFHRAEIAEINLVLYNLWDPDGNHIHVDFRLDE